MSCLPLLTGTYNNVSWSPGNAATCTPCPIHTTTQQEGAASVGSCSRESHRLQQDCMPILPGAPSPTHLELRGMYLSTSPATWASSTGWRQAVPLRGHQPATAAVSDVQQMGTRPTGGLADCRYPLCAVERPCHKQGDLAISVPNMTFMQHMHAVITFCSVCRWLWS